jgi:hypothetical protein
MSMARIRKSYGVPAKRGARVRVYGDDGQIVGSRGAYIRVRIDRTGTVHNFHPTDGVRYLVNLEPKP